MFTPARHLALCSALSAIGPQHVLAAQSDSLLPIEQVRVTVSETVRAPGRAPTLVLTIETVRRYSCLGFDIRNSLTQRNDTLRLHLVGIVPPFEACPDVVGPAVMGRDLRLPIGRHTLLIDYRSRADTLTLAITDSSTLLTGVRTSFVEPDQRLRSRFPRSSFALFCDSTDHAHSICDDVQRWLSRQAGITQLQFPLAGLNPYRPDASNAPDQRMALFRYANDAVLGRVRRCFREIKNQIRDTAQIALAIRTWTGEQITAASGRVSHEPHVQVSQDVTSGPVCSAR